MREKLKNLSHKQKLYVGGLVSILAILLVVGIKSAYAYYTDLDSTTILATKVGDFDIGKGDINIMIFRQTQMNGNLYTRSYAVPALQYTFNDQKTSCIDPQSNEVKCTNDNGANGAATTGCHYSYNDTNREFTLTSDQRVTCKFYFDKVSESDINVYIMKEDANGVDGKWHSEQEEVDKNYKMVEGVPTAGYKYAGYACYEAESETPLTNEEQVKLTYDATTKKINVETSVKTTCYAYFDSEGEADIKTHVYIQTQKGGDVYSPVEYISTSGNRTYKKAEKQNSSCVAQDEQKTSLEAQIEYKDGYVEITGITQKADCTIYLDIDQEF